MGETLPLFAPRFNKLVQVEPRSEYLTGGSVSEALARLHRVRAVPARADFDSASRRCATSGGVSRICPRRSNL